MTQADDRPTIDRPPCPTTPAETSVTCPGGILRLDTAAHPDGTTVELRLSGELDVAGSDTLRRHIGALITTYDPHQMLLDLSELSFADSSGLAAIVWAHKAMAVRGRRLRLCRPQPRVLRVLRVTGLHNRLDIGGVIPGPPRGPLGTPRRPAR